MDDEKKWFYSSGRTTIPVTWQGWIITILGFVAVIKAIDWATQSQSVPVIVLASCTPVLYIACIFFLFRKHF